jgi:AraC family transcriptional regulator
MVVAQLCRTPAGAVTSPVTSSYVVSMLVGNPVRALWRSDAGTTAALRVAGDVDIVCPGQPLIVEHDRPTEVLVVSVSEALIASAAASLGTDVETLGMVTRTRVRDPKLQHILWALNEDARSRERGHDGFAVVLGRALALCLVVAYSRPPANEAFERMQRGDVRRVFEYIDEHLDSNITLAEIARAVCLSVDGLKRLFRESVGVSAHRYIVERRVAYATSLLKDGKLPINEVALRSGFYDQSHMTRWMRRVTGATPAHVREDVRPAI